MTGRRVVLSVLVVLAATTLTTSRAGAQGDLRAPLAAPLKIKQGMANVPALSPLYLLPEEAKKYNIQIEQVMFQRFADLRTALASGDLDVGPFAHGRVHEGTLSFRLVRNRGDGLRGVTKDPNLGTHSVTHVVAAEALARCTVVQCRLETGRTHQIRIHLAEIGHPVVGDTLYGRDYAGAAIESPRTLLHAAYLSFTHPRDRRRLEFEDPLPEDFRRVIERERAATSRRPGAP